MIEHLESHNNSYLITIPMHKKYDSLKSKKNIRQIEWKYEKLFLEAKNNDVLIIGPGGIFPTENTKKLIFLKTVVNYWKLQGKRVCFFGFGVNDKISKDNIRRWQHIARKADLFATRNSHFLKAALITESVTIFGMPDVVFASDIHKYENEEVVDKDVKRLGIAVANLSPDIIDEQTDVWVHAVNTLIAKGYYVDLVAFYKDSDDILIHRIYAKSSSDKAKIRLFEYKNVKQAIANWNSYTMTICMRFHSNVVSTILNVPFLPIAYGVKTKNLADDIGIGKYVSFWNETNSGYLSHPYMVSSDEIISNSLKILNNREIIKEKTRSYDVEAKKRVEDAFAKLFAVIDRQ